MSTRCDLLDIPSELRVSIYEKVCNVRPSLPRYPNYRPKHPKDLDQYTAGPCYLLLEYDFTRTTSYETKQAARILSPYWQFSAVLCTCKLIKEEATDILYEQTLFRIDIRRFSVPSLEKCLRAVRSLEYTHLMKRSHLEVTVNCRNHVINCARVVQKFLPTLNPTRESTKVVIAIGEVLSVQLAKYGPAIRCKFTNNMGKIDWPFSPQIHVHHYAECKHDELGTEQLQHLVAAVGSEPVFVPHDIPVPT